MKKAILILFFGAITQVGFSLNSVDSTMIKAELELDSLFKSLRNSKVNSSYKKYNDAFKTKLKSTLGNIKSFRYPFDSLYMSKIYAPDSTFRLFNWNVESESGVHAFYCFILKKDGTIIELRDNHRKIISPELKSLSGKNWYGAVYYKIIRMKKGKYVLLGWNGRDGLTTEKVIESMSVSRKSVKFGLPYFQYPNSKLKKKRIILRYADDAYVSLKHYESKSEQTIVFSHLSPSTEQMRGFPQYYYPDGVDKFILTRKGKWMFVPDVNAKNPKSDWDSQYVAPKEEIITD